MKNPGNRVRVIAYIDGFNLYFGLKSKYGKKYLWLNLKKLAQNLLIENQELICTKYFTSRITNSKERERRQNTFIEALGTLVDLEIYFGKYQKTRRECYNCHVVDNIFNEKMTDVNIAVEILSDAFQNKFDLALLISGDADLTPVILAVKKLFPRKKIIIAFPPNRKNKSLSQFADKSFIIGRKIFMKSLLPDKVTKKDGFILKIPDSWG